MKNKLKILYSCLCGIGTMLMCFVILYGFLVSTLFRISSFFILLYLIIGGLVVVGGGGIYLGYRLATANLDRKYKKVLLYSNYIFGSCVIIFFIASPFIFPDIRSTEFVIENSDYSIVMVIEPMHPYFAEYHKELVLRKSNEVLVKEEMFPDTGGYLRTNLYKVDDTQYQLIGAFDAFKIDIQNESITNLGTTTPSGTFVGSFDYYECGKDGPCEEGMYSDFQFISASLRNEILYDFSYMER